MSKATDGGRSQMRSVVKLIWAAEESPCQYQGNKAHDTSAMSHRMNTGHGVARLACVFMSMGIKDFYLGSTLTSVSHLDNKRVRSALEPYLAKS
jgi:hypothetical protein